MLGYIFKYNPFGYSVQSTKTEEDRYRLGLDQLPPQQNLNHLLFKYCEAIAKQGVKSFSYYLPGGK